MGQNCSSLLQIGHDQRMYINGVVHKPGEDIKVQKEQTILKPKMSLQMDTGSRFIITEEKHLLNQQWVHLWALPGKNKKLWPRKVTGTIKCGTRSRGRETDGGKYIDK